MIAFLLQFPDFFPAYPERNGLCGTVKRYRTIKSGQPLRNVVALAEKHAVGPTDMSING